MKLSVIIPLHNGGDTIARTLDSIVKQNFSDYEVIIIADYCTDNSLEQIKNYNLPIHLITVDLDVHCAGNSRNLGLSVASGDWVTFIDQDDEFEDNAFNNVFQIIDKDNLKYICCTLLYEYNEDTNETTYHTDPQDNIDVWLHGKFYNRKNLLNKYKIRFKKNLQYLEDLYFNNKVLETLFKLNEIDKFTLPYYRVLTYKWYEHVSSTHRKLVEDKYVFNHYGIAKYYCNIVFNSILSSVPFIKTQESFDSIKSMVFADIGYLYFNYNILVYRYGSEDVLSKTLIKECKKYIEKILTNFRIKDIHELVNKTINYMIEKDIGIENVDEFITMSFDEWWFLILSK